ncbi:hypothetical protein PsYK624_028970 [Phanerochaete sordida]|uniref:Peptidase S9 prolyl oligopeptidase catalytic domain-containing protein n=1 Tax=Phanerochaete sordida TaxID=48140 RepID=A0A9P3L9R7_9APHY|nr:hypothetical protein PsYK624_028970 [Phanerochaete sordida]
MTTALAVCCALVLAAAVPPVMSSSDAQIPLGQGPNAWRVAISDSWDVLGPFPIHAREQHFLSPSFPLNLSEPIDYGAKWSSAYADTGEVGWSKATSSDGLLEISFPDVRWASLRATEGWAVLQHHAVLRTTITLYPPSERSRFPQDPPQLLVDVIQGSFFAVLPSRSPAELDASAFMPKWHIGNIYAMKASPSNTVALPTVPSLDEPTTYDLFVSGDYEIRLFGDPTVRGSDVPKLSINISARVQPPEPWLQLASDHDVLPTFVSGWAFGDALGVGLRANGDTWTVTRAEVVTGRDSEEVSVALLRETRIEAGQTRVLPLALTQHAAFTRDTLPVALWITRGNGQASTLIVELPVRQIPAWDTDGFEGIVATYLSGGATPTAFVAVPPKEASEEPVAPLLFLHGAGVPVLDLNFWLCAPPRQRHSWLVVPTGRTEWGLDWHGPSTTDAWAALAALPAILSARAEWAPWAYPASTRVVLLGHSNGGQGAWHVAERFPDRVRALVPAAAYMKAQAYVPLLHSRSARFIDPYMRAVLETALTPDDNDLFVSNLVDTPILAIHGGADENVPVWHSRALVDTLKTWNPAANVTFREDPGEPHCYDGAFGDGRTQAFIDASLDAPLALQRPRSFTLTVAIPAESGPLHGFRVLVLWTPGRLARLTVTMGDDGTLAVFSRNVRAIAIHREVLSPETSLSIEGQALPLPHGYASAPYVVARKAADGTWTASTETTIHIQPSGRASAILQSPGALTLVVPDRADGASLSAALRLAHALDVYHKLDSSIVDAREAVALRDGGALDGNVVVLGDARNAFLAETLAAARTAFALRDGRLALEGRVIGRGSSTLFLHPHPTADDAVMMVLFAEDDAALERVLRLFPIRTGITVPDWLVLDSEADAIGAAGVHAAGVWGDGWTMNGGMSSF